MKKEMRAVLEHSYMGDEIIKYIESIKSENDSLKEKREQLIDMCAYNEILFKKACEFAKEYEKALDKACELLEKHVTKTVYDVDKYGEFDYPVPVHTKEEWKERFLKNE